MEINRLEADDVFIVIAAALGLVGVGPVGPEAAGGLLNRGSSRRVRDAMQVSSTGNRVSTGVSFVYNGLAVRYAQKRAARQPPSAR
jgi:hypothetical protein